MIFPFHWLAADTKSIPSLHCPHCNSGRTELVRETFRCAETTFVKGSLRGLPANSRRPTHSFAAVGRCNVCGALFSLGGVGRMEKAEYIIDGRYEIRRELEFTIRTFTPSPRLILVPSCCPERVADAIDSSFPLFWTDRSACLNRIRTAVEFILDDLGSERRSKDGRFRTLDARIRQLSCANPEVKSLMQAIRSGGNLGSHFVEKVEGEDARDAYSVIERLLELIYLQKGSSVSVTEAAMRLDSKYSNKAKEP